MLGLILSSYGIYIGILLILRSGDVHPNPGSVFEDKALTISHANVESLYLLSDTDYPRRKIDEIESILINDLKSDIVCISETWLKPLVLDEKVDIAGFKFRRKDRLEYRSGGAGMYISDYLPNRRADEYEKEEIELLWVEITLGVKKIIVGSCYRPPGQSADEVEVFITKFQESIDQVLMHNYESILIFGDFNDTCNIWESDHHASDLGLKFYDLINSSDLHQMVHEPTRIDPPAANILDLLITDSPGYIINQKLLPPLGSKHLVVYTEFKIQYRRDKPFTRHIWDYPKGNYNQLINDLNVIPWEVGLNSFDDIDDITDYWQKSFLQVCSNNIPNRTI
jgi:exonuclease III